MKITIIDNNETYEFVTKASSPTILSDKLISFTCPIESPELCNLMDVLYNITYPCKIIIQTADVEIVIPDFNRYKFQYEIDDIELLNFKYIKE